MTTRRSFLSRLSLALSFAWMKVPYLSGKPPLAMELFFDHDTLDQLRTRFNENPLFAALKKELQELDRVAEWRFVQNEVRYNDHLFHVARLAGTAEKMAFYYVMTANEDAGMLSAECIRQLMRFPKWDYFLEGGEHVISIQRGSAVTVSVSLASDWLGDLISAGERENWLRTMGEKGCETCFRSLYGMRYPDRVVGWSMDPTSTYFEHRPNDRVDLSNWPVILDRTNLKAVPASALAIGAVAYESRFGASPDTERWLEQAVFSLASFKDLYASDGSYDENLSYADYTSLHIAQATHLLARKKGIDLYDHINWTGLMEFAAGMTMPTSEDVTTIVNFGDTGRSLFSAVPFWVAGRSFDGQAQWFGLQRSMGHSPWSVLWYDPAISEQAPPAGPHIYHSELDWVVARTGYEPADLVVAMRSGGPANHEHADRNSIIVKCFGEQLIADPYRPPYSFSDPSWMLRTTAGHSALLIDGQGHQYHDGSEGTNPSDAYAHVVRKMERDAYMLWTSDATPAYRLVHPDVESVTRTVVILHEIPVILVIDKVIKQAIPSFLQARFFAFNLDENATLETSSEYHFTVRRPNARLHGFAFSSDSSAIEQSRLPIPEDVAILHPFIEVQTQTASMRPLLITVLSPAQPEDSDPVVSVQSDADQHAVLIRAREKTLRLAIFDHGSLPEIRLET